MADRGKASRTCIACRIDAPSAVERHFAEAISATKTLERARKAAKPSARKGGRDGA
jgi:hypothetical protein